MTAANSSSISDGAAALVLTHAENAPHYRARILGHASHAQAPGWLTTAPVPAARREFSFPWLAIPLAALLVFSLWMVPQNRFNPAATVTSEIWDQLVLESVSWLRMVRLERVAESYFALEGLYPESAADLLDAGYADDVGDPWRRPYRLTTRDGRLIVTGTNAAGEPAPSLTISHMRRPMRPWPGKTRSNTNRPSCWVVTSWCVKILGTSSP